MRGETKDKEQKTGIAGRTDMDGLSKEASEGSRNPLDDDSCDQ